MKTSSVSPPEGRTKLARSFRKRPTEAEALMWIHLRNRRIGVKFRRQVPVGKYIVDFLSFEVKLVVEIDGSQHGTAKGLEKDEERDGFLKNEGYHVVRLWSYDVLSNIDGCLEYLDSKIREIQSSKK